MRCKKPFEALLRAVKVGKMCPSSKWDIRPRTMHHLSILTGNGRICVLLYFGSVCQSWGINIGGGCPKEDYFIQSRCMFPRVCDKGRYEWANGRVQAARVSPPQKESHSLSLSLAGTAPTSGPQHAIIVILDARASSLSCHNIGSNIYLFFVHISLYSILYAESGKYLQGIAAEHEIGCVHRQTYR